LRHVRGLVISGGVAIDERLERVAQLQAALVGGAVGGEPQYRVAEGHPGARPRHEDATARTRTDLDQPPGLQQANRLVDGRHRDPEALPKILLGPEPRPGLEVVHDVALELASDELRP
jgi:hypothetical protein